MITINEAIFGGMFCNLSSKLPWEKMKIGWGWTSRETIGLAARFNSSALLASHPQKPEIFRNLQSFLFIKKPTEPATTSTSNS